MVLQNPPIIYTHPVLMNRRQCVASLAVQSTWDRTPPHVCSSRTSANRQSTQRRTFHGCYHLVKKLCRTVDFRTITPCSLVGGTNLTKKKYTAFVFRLWQAGKHSRYRGSWFESRQSYDVRTGGGVHPAAYSMGTGVSSGRNSGRRRALTHSSPSHAKSYE